MAKGLKITSSLAGLIPCIGIQMTNYSETLSYITNFYRANTNDLNRVVKICPECKMPFITSLYRNQKNTRQIFCSYACSTKYTGRLRAEKNKKLAYKIINKNEFAKWFKDNNNKVIGYIYNTYDSELREDLIDVWTDKAVNWYSKMWHKDKPFPFLKLALNAYAKQITRRKREVFYDECSMAVQNKILGEITERI